MFTPPDLSDFQIAAPQSAPVALDDPQELVAYPRAQRLPKWIWSQENLVFLANLLLNHLLKTFKRYFKRYFRTK
ncbi:MAG: hypothetical protein RLZZ245_534 [Verrucomicrobiota bacterium]|jgi:hypothetical protein